MKNLLRLFLAMAMLAIFVPYAESQVSGTIAIPSTNYPTISVAIDSLNAYGVGTGGVTFNVAAGHTETLANKIITASGTSANQIIFQKSGTGANPLITAGVGVSTTLDGIIILSGADYITFNGIDLTESSGNTTTTTQMEWGYALLKVSGTDGSQNNTIKNCVISLNKTNVNTKGIYAANHTTASTTTLTVTDFAGTNSGNKINGNTIWNCYNGIYVAGYSASTPYDLYDHYNQIGYEAGNTIRLFGGSSSAVYGIYTIYQDSLGVCNNDIAGGTGTTTTQYGIMISTATNASTLVYNNTVSDTTSSTTSATYGIALNNAGVSGTDNTVIVKRNTVQGMAGTASTSGALYGFYIYYTTAVNIYVDSNKFINNKWGGTTQTATGTIYGMYIYPYTTTPVSGSIQYITNNYIAGNKRTQSTVGSGTLYGMYIYYGNQSVTAYNNIIENDTLSTTTGASYYMYVYNYYATNANYYNNKIQNIYRPAGTGATYGFYISNAAYTGTFNFYNNTANNIKSNGAASIYGIYNSASSVTKNFYENTAYNLHTSAGGSIYGIYFSGGTACNYYKNSVYNLRTSTGFGYGMYIGSGTTVNLYNNYISDIRCDSISSTLALMGLYIAGGTNVNAYYNTIYLNSVSTGTLFGTAALYASTTPAVDLRNNIIVNNSTPGTSGGYSTAYQRSSTTLTTYANTSNYNLFYAGTPDTNKLIHYDGTNKYQTLSEFKGYVSPRDANSVTENPPFVNVTTPPYDLHINASIATQCEAAGSTITTPAITDDFDGQARYPNTGYPVNPSYPPTAPDIGADEFGGIPVDLNPPTIVYTPLLNTSSTTVRILVATITDGSGVPTAGLGLPVLYWKINSSAYSAATATSLGSNQYQFSFGQGVILGDTVSYYVCAQDGATPPNVGANPSAGAGGFTANPPAAATPPTSPNTYYITQTSLSGDYTVGLTMFNQISGKNIYFEKSVKKVMKEVPVEEPVAEQRVTKGQENLKPDDKEIKHQITGKTKMVEVEEVSWVPMQNGRKYEGDLFIKKAENPNFNYPMGVNGIYATITAAVADLNLRGVSGVTRFLLNDASYTTGETYPIVVNVANENKPTATNTVTIKPNTGVTASITGDAPAARIFTILNSYVSIDGSNTVSGTTRDLTITNTSVTTPQVLVVGSTGTTPITNVNIKNTNFINGVTTSSAVIFSDGTTPGTAGWFNNLTFQNNSIKQAYIGLYSIAVISSGNGTGLNILNNDIGDSTLPVRLVDVYVQGVDGATISGNNLGKNYATTYSSNVTGVWFATGTVNSSITNNIISDITATAGGPRGIAISSAYPNANINVTGNTITNIQTAGSSPPYGIYVFSTTSGVNLKKNKIGNMLNTNTGGYGCRGINIATTVSPANIDIINNFVWNIVATSDASVTYWGIGIAIDATVSGINVYFNSVNLYGTYAGYNSATVHTAFYNSAGPTALNVRDNIFVNSYDNTTSSTDKSYSIYSAGPNTIFTDINYNDYFVSGTPGILGYLGGDQATLTAWQTATGKDLNSVSGDPKFVSNDNLHIDSNQASPVHNAGQLIASVTDDIDGNLRTSTPDIGADEYTYNPGPLTGIKYIPGDYASIPLAIADLNSLGVGTGGVTFKVAAGHVDTAANLIINTTGTSTKPIVFEKNGTGANPVVVAAPGIGLLDGIIILNGADNITFNGIDLMENSLNTNDTTRMEWGYALLKVDGTDGSQENTIKNCNITLNKINVNSKGIYSANHTTTSTTSLTVTAFSGTNSENMINGNMVKNCYIGIYVAGFADASPYPFYDHYNQIGMETGNTIRDFGGGSATTYGIYAIYQDSMAVNNNDIGGGSGSTSTNYGIFISICYNSSLLVYNNTVSDTVATLTSSSYGIALNNAGHNGVDNTVIIKRNTVKGMTNTAAATSAALYGYYIYYVTPGVYFEYDSNKYVNNNWGNTTGTFTGTIYEMYLRPYNTTPVTGSISNVTNNYIGGNNRTQSVKGSGTTYGMYFYYGLQTTNCFNNIVENDTIRNTGTFYAYYAYNYYSSTSNWHDNIARNIVKSNGSSGAYYGFYMSAGSSSTGTFNFYNNSAYNVNADTTAILYGMYISGSSATKNVYGNSVYNLNTSMAGSVYGIYQASGTAINIYKNRIYSLRTATGIGYGMYISSGTTNTIYNNFISGIRADSSISTPGVYGMYISGGTTQNLYYNTIYLNAVSTGANFGSAGIYASTTPTVELRNNIIVNNSTPAGTGNTVAYQRSSTTLTTYSGNSDRNCFYAGTPGANNLIFFDGTNAVQTIAAFKTLVAPRDANSFTENPPFVNVTTPPYDLHLQTTVPTFCESGALPVSGITDDYDGNPRDTVTPDVGADEGNFTPAGGALAMNLKVYLEGFWNGTTQVVDTAHVYLASSSSPYAFADSQTVVLAANGTADVSFANASAGNYYIVVKHRNHLETWSRLPQTFVVGTPLNYDFTTDSAKAYGYNMKKVGSVWTLFAGDANQDGSVDALDVAIFITQFGNLGYLSCDFNGDNSVDALDVQIFIGDFGLTKAVPTLVSTPTDPGAREKKKEEIRKKFDTEMRKVKNNTD
jgi:hypothetical protein